MQAGSKPLSDLSLEELSALAARFDRPGPRYTSYPTAVQFSESFGPPDYLERLERASERPGEPLSMYIHIPFCARRCNYCGCHTLASAQKSLVEDYLERLEGEIDLVAEPLGTRRSLKVLHLGGGTPTYLRPAQLERLFGKLRKRFETSPGAEISVELDPRVTTELHIRTLRSLGVNRVSLGVQDFNPSVQEAIGRFQGAEETVRIYQSCRDIGFDGINLDLVYGLPRQTLESMVESIQQVIRLLPDRVAIYGYAHVPWMRPHQKAIQSSDLPEAPERLRLFLKATELFLEAGYLQIGMDHFALPEDELAVAQQSRRLGRNFMGYTPHSGMEIIGLGISSIGQVSGAYAQNQKEIPPYSQMIESGTLPIQRGIACTRDDEIRRHAIHQILCNFRLDFQEFQEVSGFSFQEYFRREEPEIEVLIREGLIERDLDGISVTPLGRSFVRNVAMALDRHNRPSGKSGSSEDGPRFSRTV